MKIGREIPQPMFASHYMFARRWRDFPRSLLRSRGGGGRFKGVNAPGQCASAGMEAL